MSDVMQGRGPFETYAASDLISRLGSAVTVIALPLVALRVLDASALQVALLTTFGSLVNLLFGLPVGVWVDRLRKRPVLIASDLVQAVLLASVPLAVWLDLLSLAQLYLVMVGMGVAGIFSGLARVSYLQLLLPPQRRLSGYSRLTTNEAVGNIAGPGLAGALLHLAAPAVAIIFDILTYLTAAALKTRIPDREPQPSRSRRTRMRTEMGEGIRLVARQPVLRILLAHTSTVTLCGAMVTPMLIVFLERDLGASALTYAVVFTTAGVFVLAGSFLVHRLERRLGMGRALCVSSLLTGLCWLAIPLTPTTGWPWPLLLGNAAGLAFSRTYQVLQLALRQELCPPELNARTNAVVRSVGLGAFAVGAFLGGVLATAHGVRTALTIGVLGHVVVTLPLWATRIRTITKLPTTDPAAVRAG